jgi:hypothetical protein
MNKTWQLRVCALYLTVGLPLAASCAREANTLDEEEPSGSSGSTSSEAGTSSKAGSGSGKAGTTGAFGGTSGKAGSGAGGNATGDGGEATGDGGDAPSAGTAGSSGTTSAAGSGGAGGSTGVPPDVLARAGAIVHYQTSHTTASDGTIQMKLFIVNQSADDLPMVSVKIRYWFTAEVTPDLHQYYTGPQAQQPKAAFVSDGANSHTLLTFGGGAIKKGGDINASEVQLEMTNNGGKFNQADDFSWEPTSTTSKPNGKITLYLADKLIWGCEPSGACFDDAGAGGAGGMTGAGGAQ